METWALPIVVEVEHEVWTVVRRPPKRERVASCFGYREMGQYGLQRAKLGEY